MHIRGYQIEDQGEVVALWEACGITRSWNNPVKDIERKLKVQGEWFLVGEVEGKLVGSVMAGYDGHRGWVNYLAVHPEYQRRGYARALMAEVERLFYDFGVPKINLQIRSKNAGVIAFYKAIGYGVDDVMSMGKRLHED